jgi:hypothetical protein
MKSVVMPFRKPAGDGRKLQPAGTSTAWLAGKPFQDAAYAKRRVWFDLVVSVWSGATVGFMAAAFIPPSLGRRASNTSG